MFFFFVNFWYRPPVFFQALWTTHESWGLFLEYFESQCPLLFVNRIFSNALNTTIQYIYLPVPWWKYFESKQKARWPHSSVKPDPRCTAPSGQKTTFLLLSYYGGRVENVVIFLLFCCKTLWEPGWTIIIIKIITMFHEDNILGRNVSLTYGPQL